jgi:hypothetical protein
VRATLKLLAAFIAGGLFGALAGVRYVGRGDGCGDWNYTYRTYSWRGRRIEIHIEDGK